MEFNTESFAQQCMDAINNRIRNLNKLNIIVVGKSGVGKSTLINSLFRGNLTQTGLGRPVTDCIRKIEKADYPMAIYDTPGFELGKGQQNKVKDEILDLIEKGVASRDVNQAIHCMWYCINVGGNRTFDESEIAWLKDFTKSNKTYQIPIIIVLTQACPKSKAQQMKELVEKENLPVIKVIPVLAQDMNFDDEYIAKAYGLDTLIDVMEQALPTELQDTLQNVQKASLEAKKKSAQKAVASAVALTFGEGFAPVPFADSALMIPTQVTMIATITAIFSVDVNKSVIRGFIGATLGSGIATVVGKTIATNLLKLMPGVGSIVGGVVSGATAGIITTALGETYIKLMEMMYRGDLKGDEINSEETQKYLNTAFAEGVKRRKIRRKADGRAYVETETIEQLKAEEAQGTEDVGSLADPAVLNEPDLVGSPEIQE